MLSINGTDAIVASTIRALELEIDQFGNELYEDLVTQNFSDPDIYERIIEFEEDVKNIIRNEFGYEQWVENFVPVYMANFSEAEIDELIKFYQSDVGRALVERTPSVMAQSAMIGQETTKQYMLAIEPLQKQLFEDLDLVQ